MLHRSARLASAGGSVAVASMAREFLAHDESQVEYYEHITIRRLIFQWLNLCKRIAIYWQTQQFAYTQKRPKALL